MNPKLIVAILVIAAVPVCAHAQPPSAAKVSKADAQKVLKIISGDKVKSQTYCDIAELDDQIDKADEKKDTERADELFRKRAELATTLGPEYAALMDGVQDVDPNSKSVRRSVRCFRRSTSCVSSNGVEMIVPFLALPIKWAPGRYSRAEGLLPWGRGGDRLRSRRY